MAMDRQYLRKNYLRIISIIMYKILGILACSAVALASPGQKPSNPLLWKLAVQTWTFNSSSFADAIAKADSCGFKYIEAYPGQKLGGGQVGEMGPSMSREARQWVKDLLKKRGMALIAFGVVDGTDDAKTDADWKKAFDFAQEMGIREITAMPTLAQLDMVNTLSGKYHIPVAIHDEPGRNSYDHPDSVQRAIRNRPNLGACVDIGNWVRNGVDVAAALKNQLEGRVFSLHLKDVKQAGSEHAQDVVLGRGACNLPAVFRELKRQGFQGFLSIEHESRGPADLAAVRADVAYFQAEIRKL
jgi:sugar phosphate isomerase/epimerase